MADAFHIVSSFAAKTQVLTTVGLPWLTYLCMNAGSFQINDLVSFVVALYAVIVSPLCLSIRSGVIEIGKWMERVSTCYLGTPVLICYRLLRSTSFHEDPGLRHT